MTAGMTAGGPVCHVTPVSDLSHRMRPRWTDTNCDDRHAAHEVDRDIVTVRGQGRPPKPEEQP
jgi:hypothetical protein